MSGQPVLVTVTDGMDTRRNADDFVEAVRALRSAGVFPLSVGIGSTDVDHRGLAYLAHLTGGEHVVAITSEAIAEALADVTTILLTAVQRQEHVVRTEEALLGRLAVAVQRAAVRVKVDALLLIDNSGSMFGVSDSGTGDPQKMPRTKAAISRLVDTLRPPDHDGTEYDRVAVSAFSDDYNRLTGFTSDFSSVVRAVNGIGQGGGTSLYRSIAAAAREFS